MYEDPPGVPNGIRSHRAPAANSGPTVNKRQNLNLGPSRRATIPANDPDQTCGSGILAGIPTRTVTDGSRTADQSDRDRTAVACRSARASDLSLCDFCGGLFAPPRWNCRTCQRCAARGAPDPVRDAPARLPPRRPSPPAGRWKARPSRWHFRHAGGPGAATRVAGPFTAANSPQDGRSPSIGVTVLCPFPLPNEPHCVT